MTIRKSGSVFLILAMLVSASANAAPPPDRMNYQGVLRNATDEPLDGAYDMVFRFWSAENAGDEILVDRHLAVDGNAVSVTGGLFSVQLGLGQVLDGSGPGTYTSLAQVFADYGDVWLEIEIESETLSPRIAVASAGYALNAGRLDGRSAGEFVDTSATTQTKSGKLVFDSTGQLTFGMEAYGDEAGGNFADADGSGRAWVAVADLGIQAWGNEAGGLFQEADGSGYAYLGQADRGIWAAGNDMGGYFKDNDQSAYAHIAVANRGLEAFGTTMGGRFEDSDGSGYAEIGINNDGIRAYGNSKGGYFADLNGSGYANVGIGDRGIEGFGNETGGYFADSDGSGFAYVGNGDYGIQASGGTAGGYFEDSNGSGSGHIGFGDYGVRGVGDFYGGGFTDSDESGWARVGHSTYKIYGNGAVSFVQNHPEDASRVIVYHAPEASEVAVYTRGSARLSSGRAVVDLDTTFRWVANPDLGLTANVTARGTACALYVESVTTEQLVVAPIDAACSDAVFDYMVWGLRIGFEESTPVQAKEHEAYIPSMKAHRERAEAEPELASFTALERFKSIAAAIEPEVDSEVDLSRARALVAAIHEFDPRIDRIDDMFPDVEAKPTLDAAERDDASISSETTAGSDEATIDAAAPAAAGREAALVAEPLRLSESSEHDAADDRSDLPSGVARMEVSGAVEAGDLLALDSDRSGILRAADAMADPSVVGVAVGPVDSATATAPVLTFGIAAVRVDAAYGAIRPGDLLVSSPTPGHAMSALETLPGTIIGKALEALESGTGTINVLLMPR